MPGFRMGILSGLCMSVQGVFNTQVTKSSGIRVANIFVQATALLVCIAARLIGMALAIGGILLLSGTLNYSEGYLRVITNRYL